MNRKSLGGRMRNSLEIFGGRLYNLKIPKTREKCKSRRFLFSLPPHHSPPLLIWPRTSLRVCIAFQPEKETLPRRLRIPGSSEEAFSSSKRSSRSPWRTFFSFKCSKDLVTRKINSKFLFRTPLAGRSFLCPCVDPFPSLGLTLRGDKLGISKHCNLP